MRQRVIGTATFSRALLAALALAAALVLSLEVLATPAASASSSHGKSGSRAPAKPASAGVITGIGDENSAMFYSRFWTQLHLGITRYFVPYDVVAHRRELNEARGWIEAATRAHQQILIAFYHSQQVPMRNPSASLYRSDVAKFLRLFPQIHQYEPWNESNRGFVPGYFTSPTAYDSALYYRELRSLAHHDTVLGLDILDSYDLGPTLTYVNEFKNDIRRLHVPMPTLWGLHNYSDTNRFTGTRTKQILETVPGKLWLTETGGVVQFGTDFTNVRGSGLRRAAHALEYMYKLAYTSPRIQRLYIYNWFGETSRARFDAGIMDRFGHPRLGYVVVCDHQLHYSKRCHVHVNSD
jgi:hypothetical protein